MGPTEPKLPSEAIELYNDFIHGEISRRAFMEGVQRLAGGLAAATVINALMPNYALGQQVSRTDDRIKATYETVPSPKGNGSIKGYLVRPVSADSRSETITKLPGVIVVHENRGLNPHIEDIARRFALANFMAFAPRTDSHLWAAIRATTIRAARFSTRSTRSRCLRIWWPPPCG